MSNKTFLLSLIFFNNNLSVCFVYIRKFVQFSVGILCNSLIPQEGRLTTSQLTKVKMTFLTFGYIILVTWSTPVQSWKWRPDASLSNKARNVKLCCFISSSRCWRHVHKLCHSSDLPYHLLCTQSLVFISYAQVRKGMRMLRAMIQRPWCRRCTQGCKIIPTLYARVQRNVDAAHMDVKECRCCTQGCKGMPMLHAWV